MAGTAIPWANASIDTMTAMKAPQISGLIAGADLAAGAACYIASTGLVELCDATAADALASFHGMVARDTKEGQPCTLFGPGARFLYDSAGGLTPGMQLFLDVLGTGSLIDTAQTGDSTGVAVAITATDIIVTNYKLIGG